MKIKKTKTQGNTEVGTSFGKLSASLKGRMPVDSMSLPPESGSHNEMHNLVYGRISDEKDKGAVYAGI